MYCSHYQSKISEVVLTLHPLVEVTRFAKLWNFSLRTKVGFVVTNYVFQQDRRLLQTTKTYLPLKYKWRGLVAGLAMTHWLHVSSRLEPPSHCSRCEPGKVRPESETETERYPLFQFSLPFHHHHTPPPPLLVIPLLFLVRTQTFPVGELIFGRFFFFQNGEITWKASCLFKQPHAESSVYRLRHYEQGCHMLVYQVEVLYDVIVCKTQC